MRSVNESYTQFLQEREAQSLKRNLVPLQHLNAREVALGGKTFLNFCGNDYLGLSFDPRLKERATSWMNTHGNGAGASRLVTGNIDAYQDLEAKLAEFKGFEAALVMVSGYQTNASVLPALFDKSVLGAEPLIFSDKYIHASMHAGCIGFRQIRFAHNDMAHLESLLEKHQDLDQPKFILSESVFSMDGDIAPLEALYALRDKHNAFLVIDEAHATGVMGSAGSGLAHKADLVIGTFGKAMGCFGAYVACSSLMKEYLVNKCGGIIYATGLPPMVLGAIDASLDIALKMNEERAHLRALYKRFKDEAEGMGYTCGATSSQIVPILLHEAQEALDLMESFKDRGIWVSAIRPPTVPKGSSRLRFTFSAAHQQADLDLILNILSDQKGRYAA